MVVAPLTLFCNNHNWFSITFSTHELPALPLLTNASELFNSTLVETITDAVNATLADHSIQPVVYNRQLIFSLKEILLFSAVISATDTVAALTFIKEDQEPKLFAILFGEGVINDAVCIVLYGILREFTSSDEGIYKINPLEFTSSTPFMMLSSFMGMFFYSFLIGGVVGMSSSLFLKKLKHIRLNRVQECSVIVFFAFISYTLTEELGLSPIIALLFTGIFMSHYTFYNLSFQAREESAIVSKIMSNIAEAFVFTYLGLTVIYYTTNTFSFSFIFCEMIFVILGRVIAIFGISYIMKLLKVRSFKMQFSHKGIMSCAGSIRGAIAFGLAISIDTKNTINK
jgi:NhaP-type Na+/H+ or K+/H+ antiporter